MQASFDVIREPWITVVDFELKKHTVSVRELFENANTYYTISEPNMYYSYGIYNFLIALFASAYKMKDMDDKMELLETGSFDMSIFDSYIEKCEKNRPGCFNLFGDNPFYQNINVKFKSGKENKKSMIGKIALHIPSGQNTFFFCNQELIGKKIGFSETTKALVSHGLFQAGKDGTNSARGVNGGLRYPLYFLIKGRNVFDSIVLNTITEETWHSKLSNKVSYTGDAIWERVPDTVEKHVYTSVSMTEGLTFQNRHVLLDEPNSDGLIDMCYFGPGRVFDSDKGLWRQPNASYKLVEVKSEENKKGKVPKYLPLCMFTPHDIWTDMGSLFSMSHENTLISTVQEYKYILDDSPEILSDKGYKKRINYMVYYICLVNGFAPASKQGVYENFLPVSLLNNKHVLDKFDNLIESASSIGNLIKTDLFNSKEDNTYFSMRQPYYHKVETDLLPELLSNISEISDSSSFEEEFEKLCNNFKLKLKDCAVETYMNYVLNFGYKGVCEYKSKDGKTTNKRYLYGVITKESDILKFTINKVLNL